MHHSEDGRHPTGCLVALGMFAVGAGVFLFFGAIVAFIAAYFGSNVMTVLLPAAFQWLASVSSPLMVVVAMKEFGTMEAPGAAINPKILAWARETGQDAAGYVDDAIPWCGLFMAVCAKRAGKLAPDIPLRALSWAFFGTPSPTPSLGDVLVFKRQGGGHVALYVGEDDANFFCLGGNQGDAVSIAPKLKSGLHACRRPIYRVKPANVKPVRIGPAAIASAGGGTSEV